MLLLGTLLFLPPIAEAGVRKVCQTQTGDFVARKRCRKTESAVQIQAFYPSSLTVPGPTGAAGPKGPAGAKGATGAKGTAGDTGAEGPLAIENCRTVSVTDTNFVFPSDSELSAAPTCNASTEYMLTYSFDANDTNVFVPNPDPNLLATVRAISLLGSGVPVGVEVTANRFATTSVFALRVDAVCCPRS